MKTLLRSGSNFKWLAFIVCAGLALRLAAIVSYRHAPESDELAYQAMALNMVNGNGIVDNMGNLAMYNVGYPLFALAPVYFLFGDSLFAARILNVLLGGCSILLVYFVSVEAGAQRLGRLLAAAAWAAYLPASIYAVYLLKENLLIPVMLGVMWCILRLLERPSARISVCCGLLFGLLALTGSAALPLVTVALAAFVLGPGSKYRKASFAALFVLSAAAVVTPWLTRNFIALGSPVLNTNGGFNLYLGNNPNATGLFVSIGDTPRGQTWEALRKTGEVQASKTLQGEAVEWAMAHPGKAATLAMRKAMYFWMPPIHKGAGQSSSAEGIVRFIWLIQFVALLIAACAGLFFAQLRTRRTVLFWAAIGSYTMIHMIFYVIYRYREPIIPFIAVLAAIAFEAWRNTRLPEQGITPT